MANSNDYIQYIIRYVLRRKEDAIYEEDGHQLSKVFKFMLTASMYLVAFCFGYGTGIIGPALSKTTDKLNTTTDVASIMFFCQYIGFTVGALTAGIITEYVNRQLFLMGILLIQSIAVPLIPLCSSIGLLYTDVAISGFGYGVMNVVIIVWIFELWGEDSVKHLYGVEISLALGSFIAPIISEQFLSKVTNNTQPLNANTDGIQPYFIPFFIAGAFLFMSSTSLLVLHLYKRYVPPMDARKDQLSTGRKSRIVYIVLGLLILPPFLGNMYMCFELIVTFSMDSHLKLTDSEATNVQSVMSAAYLLMTVLTLILSFKFWSQKLIYVFLIVIIIANIVILLYEWCQWSEWALMVGASLLGIGLAPVYPALYSYLGQLFTFTNTMGGVFVCFEGLMAALMPTICGQFISSNPLSFIYMNILLMLLCLLSYLMLNVIVFRNVIKEEISSDKDNESLYEIRLEFYK